MLVRGCWSKGSLEDFFPLSIILQKDEFSFLFHAESLSTWSSIFVCCEVVESYFHFKTLFLGVSVSRTHETWDLEMETAFTLYFSLSSGIKVTGLQAGKLTQTTWGKYIDSLSSSEDFSQYCWLVVLFLRKHWCIPQGTSHLPYKPQSPQNACRQLSCSFAFDTTKPVLSAASLHML